MMMAIYNLHVEYGHCTANHMYKNVLNDIVNVTNGLWVSFSILYTCIDIIIMEVIGLGNENVNSHT
jgi:hypothetical protein